MPHLRYNPLLDTFTMVASNRQHRPHLPGKETCPFCPDSGKVDPNYDVISYPNDFPVLSNSPESCEAESEPEFYKASQAYGRCEVILYSPDHNAKMYDLANEKVEKIIQLWIAKNAEFSLDPKLKYIYPFENRGKEVGVTIPHPHGQLYAYGWLPLKIKTELDNARKYTETTGKNLFEEMIQAEKTAGTRMLDETPNFACFIPYFTDYPFGVFIVNKNKANLAEFQPEDISELAILIKKVVYSFDHLFDREFPYMMAIHQTPVNLPEFSNASGYFRFHIEFYPPLRDKEKIKWYASSEMGAWAAANTLSVEACAAELRKHWPNSF
ncbi:MAG: galactose-1-phosphate uridylyltransferase [Bacteroidia bacterium]|nr:galactose-1-phosphate uridylyltransferase [Bacteroidia bacterium]